MEGCRFFPQFPLLNLALLDAGALRCVPVPCDPMNSKYSNPRELFTAVLDLESDGERRALLDEVAELSPELVESVRDLLRAHDQAECGEFFSAKPRWYDQAQVDGDVSIVAIDHGEGSQIGRYRLLEKIGEGGMGVVYMAEQQEPVRRKVALKIIKLGWIPSRWWRASRRNGRHWR